jgi:hypothetical protein
MGGTVEKVWQTNVESPLKDAWNKNIRDKVAGMDDMLGGGAPDAGKDPTSLIDSEIKRQEEERKKIGPAPVMTAGQQDGDAKRRRRLAAMRSGIMSTIKTSAAGLTNAPNLLAPQAFAAGLKSKLGQ